MDGEMTERMEPDVAMGNKIHMCKFAHMLLTLSSSYTAL